MKNLLVTILLLYIKLCARLALLLHRPIVIGVTGSAGKTSTRDALYAMLKDYRKAYMIKKGNSETGIPLGILGLQVESIGFDSIHSSIKDWIRIVVQAPFRIFFLKKYRYLIIEMGIDGPLPPKNMDYLLSIVKPDMATVLNVYPVHAAQYEKVIEGPITDEKLVKAIALEKAKIVTHNRRCTYAVYNNDIQALTEILDTTPIVKDTFGEASSNALTYSSYKLSAHQTSFGFKHDKDSIRVTINNYALPEAYREVFAATILIGLHIGLDIQQIQDGISKNFTTEQGRSTLLPGINETTIIDSSYNSSPSSALTILKMAYILKDQTKKPLVFVFGDMRELGHAEKAGHEMIVESIKGHVDYLYTVGPITEKYVYTPLKKEKSFKDIQAFTSPHDLGKFLKRNLPKDALVLFKGSQNTIFLEEAIKYILANSEDSEKLPRQEKYWLRKKHFTLQHDVQLNPRR